MSPTVAVSVHSVSYAAAAFLMSNLKASPSNSSSTRFEQLVNAFALGAKRQNGLKQKKTCGSIHGGALSNTDRRGWN